MFSDVAIGSVFIVACFEPGMFPAFRKKSNSGAWVLNEELRRCSNPAYWHHVRGMSFLEFAPSVVVYTVNGGGL